MGMIRTLDIQTANSIAAGEVVERPASVVKELCENAMDAAATSISVEIRNGGVSSIRISDNGCGMDHEDALAAFGRHATSKLRTIADLDSIGTMGFRGEALSSIAAVSRVTLHTRRPGAADGSLVRMEGGKLLEHARAGCPDGSTIEVESLFYNTPARFKFLKRDVTEGGYIGDVIEKLALSRPDISFRLVSNGQEILRTPGNNDLMSAVYSIYGKQTASQCLPVAHHHESLLVTGFAGVEDSARNNRSRQVLHVNGRTVQSRVFTAAVDEAYRNRMMKGKHPFVLLRLELPPNLVDVNVHPQKLEVRFWNESEVFLAFLHALKNALEQNREIPEQKTEDTPERPPLPEPMRLADLLPEEQGDADFASLPPTGSTAPSGTATGPSPSIDTDGSYLQPSATPEPAVVSEPPASYDAGRPFLSGVRIIGSVFGTYVLLEDRDDLILMDQHAAHERILFERLLSRASSGHVQIQELLLPAMLDVTAREAQVLEAERERIESIGFRFDAFGTQSIAIRAIPGNEREIMPIVALRAVLDDLLEDHASTQEDTRTALYATIACKAAVKAGDRLDEAGIRALLQDLAGLDNPYQCPHGRPTLFRITRRELEKRFRRIV